MLRGEVTSTILAIETSSKSGSLALSHEGDVLGRRDIVSDRNHNSELFPALDDLLADLPSGGLDLIIIGTGPGSFNGTRVAIAVGQALALVHKCPVVGLMSLHALPSVSAGGEMMVCGDARRQRFYRQLAREGALVGPVELLKREELMAEAAAFAGQLVTNDESARLPFLNEVAEESPTAEGLMLAWQTMSSEQRAAQLAIPVEPAYLRPPHISRAKPRVRPVM